MLTETTNGAIEEQLETLYAEREWLAQEIGCGDAESIVEMVKSLEVQLADHIRTHGGRAPLDATGALTLLNHVTELSQRLDGLYSQKSVTFEMVDDKPVLRAIWTEHTNQGDAQ